MNKHCFAAVNGKCAATKSDTCEGCKFFKTVSQLNAELTKCERRLKAKGLLKYYNDKYDLM